MLVDVALLTDKGIAFVMIPQATLQRLQQAMEKDPDPSQYITITCEDDKVYEGRADMLLVRYRKER